jgi:FkbM family methyltransferase
VLPGRLRRGFAAAQRRRRGRRLYRQFLRPGSLCFDVGANVGERAAIFSSLGARVVAVEPQPACAEILRARGFVVEQVALGASPGTGTMRVASASTISSMSDGWIQRVQESRRFDGYRWGDAIDVPLTTLDALIEKHGVPDFCKVDVEGYEPEVFAGLSQPLPAVSFEFTPEWTDAATAVVERLVSLGFQRFNFSFGESLRLSGPWRDAASVLAELDRLRSDTTVFGDVYARTMTR